MLGKWKVVGVGTRTYRESNLFLVATENEGAKTIQQSSGKIAFASVRVYQPQMCHG